MQKISGNDLHRLIPIIKEDNLNYPMALSVLEGTFSGYAYVDSPITPKKAVVFHTHLGFLHYIGNKPNIVESEAIAKAVLNYRSDREDCNWIEFAHSPASVSRIIKKERNDVDEYLRISWHNDPNLFHKSPEPNISKEYTIELIGKKHISNKILKDEIELFWDSTDEFLENTFGVVALDSEQNIVGACSSVSDSDNYYEINIEVTKENRRKGLGYAMAYRFIQECYDCEKSPHWDSLERNKPSNGLAKKLGFFEMGKYPITYWTNK